MFKIVGTVEVLRLYIDVFRFHLIPYIYGLYERSASYFPLRDTTIGFEIRKAVDQDSTVHYLLIDGFKPSVLQWHMCYLS